MKKQITLNDLIWKSAKQAAKQGLPDISKAHRLAMEAVRKYITPEREAAGYDVAGYAYSCVIAAR